MFDRIAIATDGSESNKAAIRQGIGLAKRLGVKKVTAICVFDIGSYRTVSREAGVGDRDEGYELQAAQEALQNVVREGKEKGVEVETRIITGHPAEALIKESANFDLMVTGTLGKSGLERALIGSVAERVVRMAHCPVLVCRCPKAKKAERYGSTGLVG